MGRFDSFRVPIYFTTSGLKSQVLFSSDTYKKALFPEPRIVAFAQREVRLGSIQFGGEAIDRIRIDSRKNTGEFPVLHRVSVAGIEDRIAHKADIKTVSEAFLPL